MNLIKSFISLLLEVLRGVNDIYTIYTKGLPVDDAKTIITIIIFVSFFFKQDLIFFLLLMLLLIVILLFLLPRCFSLMKFFLIKTMHWVLGSPVRMLVAGKSCGYIFLLTILYNFYRPDLTDFKYAILVVWFVPYALWTFKSVTYSYCEDSKFAPLIIYTTIELFRWASSGLYVGCGRILFDWSIGIDYNWEPLFLATLGSSAALTYLKNDFIKSVDSKWEQSLLHIDRQKNLILNIDLFLTWFENIDLSHLVLIEKPGPEVLNQLNREKVMAKIYGFDTGCNHLLVSPLDSDLLTGDISFTDEDSSDSYKISIPEDWELELE